MLKNRAFTAFAVAGLLGLAACGGAEEEPAIIEEPVIEEPAPAIEPAPAPMTTDTMMMDTAALPADTAAL